MKELKIQLIREIQETAIPELFLSYNPTSHVFSKHYQVSDRELKERLRTEPYKKGEIICKSRFQSDNKEEITILISNCLFANQTKILKWLQSNPYQALELCAMQDMPIGIGYVRGTDWKQGFQMSKLAVILKNSDKKGRLFQIVTAFPVPGLDEIDEIYQAMDEWKENRQIRRDV